MIKVTDFNGIEKNFEADRFAVAEDGSVYIFLSITALKNNNYMAYVAKGAFAYIEVTG